MAQAVEAAGHSVAIIDRKETAFRRLDPEFSGKRIVGVGFDRDRLDEAGINDAAAVVARIYDPRRAAIYERLGIPTVATVQWTIERVLRRILPESPSVEWIDPSAKVCLIERVVPAKWAGHRVGELDVEARAHVVALSRLGMAQLCRNDLVIQDGDVVYVAIAGDHIGEFDEHLVEETKGGH